MRPLRQHGSPRPNNVTDVKDDLHGTSTTNNWSSLRVDLGGNYEIVDGDTLLPKLSNVSMPSE